jgi:predicted DNA-binding protein (MmcQ/YjbR family)
MSASVSPEVAFQSLREQCIAQPDAVEEFPWGHVAFKIGGKIFAILREGAPPTVTLKPPSDDREALLSLPNVEVAAYVGRYGWLTIAVPDEEAVTLARELIAASYGQVKPKRRARKAE